MNGLYKFDMDGFRAIHIGLHQKWLDPIFFVITGTGLGWVQLLLILTLLRGKVTKMWVFPLLLTLLVSGFVVADGIKLFIARDRPSNLAFTILQDESAFAKSFPSGHTSTSFGLAFMLLLLTWRRENAWVGWTALLWACLVGVSRIYRGLHWPTDVLGGVFVGALSAGFVYLLLGKVGKLTHLDKSEASLSGVEAE